ncbi:MAG: right-handed parallel beta-helix repeat-containing protein [Candidatus Woesearchaeota archaeon]
MKLYVVILLFFMILLVPLLTGCGNNLPPCDSSCTSRGLECGSHVVCYGPIDCGTCGSGELCVKGTCQEMPTRNTYFVATDGKDSNPGTIEEPWATLQHAIYLAKPGDTVYIRGGIYYSDGPIGGDPSIGIGYSGTPDAPVRFFNYPGERPIFDWSRVSPNIHGWNSGMGWTNAEYIHLKGFTIRNVHQNPPDFKRRQKPYSEAYGLSCSMCANMVYEDIIVHDIDGRGFQHWTGAWNDFDAEYAVKLGYQKELQQPIFESDTTYFINCDAYNLYDRYSEQPGNAADGWKVETYYGNTFHWIGCRAWNYSDDGFDPHGSGTRIFDNCWAMSTDKYEGLSEDWGIEGNGYKMTGVGADSIPGYVAGKEPLVIMRNSIAANCVGSGGGVGFYNNIGIRYGGEPNGGVFYNNLAYKNGIGYSDSNKSTYRNNIVYDSVGRDAIGEKYELATYLAWYNESNNSWVYNDPSPGSIPWWYYNPAFNVTDEDFLSLDYWQLTAPRRSDGSLPDIDFGHLRNDSELIDAGIIIPGYHCQTAGYQEGCVVWYGIAPDLGPFEYNPGPEPIVCSGPDSRPCAMKNAYAIERRSCIGPGEWSGFGVCEFVRCDDGYVLEDDTCVIGPGWSKELVYNGGFEGSVDGWVTSSKDWDSFAYNIWGAVHYPQAGHYVAYISNSSSAEDYIYQDVDLTEYADYIDAGLVVANVSGWGISTAAFAAKNAIKFMFLDEDKNIISTPLDTGYIENPEWWEAKLSEEPIPEGTRYVRVWANTYDIYNMGLPSGDLDSFSVKINILR